MQTALLFLSLCLVTLGPNDTGLILRHELAPLDRTCPPFDLRREWKARVPLIFAAFYVLVAAHVARKFSRAPPKKQVTFLLARQGPTFSPRTPIPVRSILKKTIV